MTNFGSSNENRLEDPRTYLVESWMLAGNRMTLDEPAGYEQETEPTEEEEDTGTGQDIESDSDSEQTEEPAVRNQGQDILSRREEPLKDFRMQSMCC